MQGFASEVAKGTEWDSLKDIFLKKNPFEEPFFGNPLDTREAETHFIYRG
jgi:hypothetical protein